MRFAYVVSFVAAIAAPLLVGCSGSSGKDAPYTSDGGNPTGDSGTQGGGDSSTQPPPADGSAPPGDSGSGADETGTPTPGSDTGPVASSSGIVITVIPDGTGDAAGLLSAMQGAKTAVHMEMYLLTNATYINALTTLAKSGIDVKVILNQTFPSGTSSSDTNASSYTQLQQGGVSVSWAPTTTGFDSYTHEKTVIIDPGSANGQAWIMTMNLDTDAPKYNREYLALDTNAADVTEAEDIFEADYASTSITPSGSLIVAPSPQNNAQPAILALIQSATTSIDVESEEYDSSGLETAIASALVAKAQSGVTVHMVLETSTESSQSTAVSALQAAGGKVVGYTYSGSSGLDIHAKAIVVDGATAYVGSENLSGGSLGYNRELGVIFSEPSEVAKVASTIGMDFSGGTTY
jgi:phosphatidylserine/phosphatidylglycerophosphate/cardiolipin synthase-like enzyme